MLVVDPHTLQAVNLLNLVEQVLLDGPRPLHPQYVVRVHRPLRETVSRPHQIALVHAEVLAHRDLVDHLLATVHGDDEIALTALDAAEGDAAVDLRDRGRILRAPRLEQLGDTRQATRDVPRLVGFPADLGDGVARAHGVAIVDQ